MYSVAKSLSVSTPRVLLGRSFTWPRDASTVKPAPRYFWMVFALAGDSTMTKPLLNRPSVNDLLSKLARMSSWQQGTAVSSWLLAVGFCLEAYAASALL